MVKNSLCCGSNAGDFGSICCNCWPSLYAESILAIWLRIRHPAHGQGTSVIDNKQIAIGVDIGGTFTDVVLIDEMTRSVYSAKVLTTPEHRVCRSLGGRQHLG